MCFCLWQLFSETLLGLMGFMFSYASIWFCCYMFTDFKEQLICPLEQRSVSTITPDVRFTYIQGGGYGTGICLTGGKKAPTIINRSKLNFQEMFLNWGHFLDFRGGGDYFDLWSFNYQYRKISNHACRYAILHVQVGKWSAWLRSVLSKWFSSSF